MISSAARHEDAERCRALGLAAYMSKPLTQSDLFDAIVTALGGAVVSEPPPGSPVASPLRAPRRILLVEDNAVNQIVARRLLEKMGHQVTLAADGEEAVAAVLENRFDLVLMDIQMPNVDGYEATRRIRASESPDALRLPIIALTAHAMKGEDERCREAGMDGHLSKPIAVPEFTATLDCLFAA